MKVKIAADMSGTRNGQDWPKRGTVMDLPDDEARTMLDNGTAKELDADDPEPEPVTGASTEAEPTEDDDRRPVLDEAAAVENEPLTTENGPTKTVRRASTKPKG